MKRLFMIRLENGNSMILQAETKEEAIENAGLRIDPAASAAYMETSDVLGVHLLLVREGIGPQNYTIRELHSFKCSVELTGEGDFDFYLDGDEAEEEFHRDYPHLAAITEGIAKMDPEDPALKNIDLESRYAEAIAKEKTRLLIVQQ